MRTEQHNLHGTGSREHEVYDMPLGPHVRPGDKMSEREYWPAVTDVPCPVKGCTHTVMWYEADYVPGYRVCMAPLGGDRFDADSIKHRFFAMGDADHPVLVRDDCCEA